MHVQYGRWMGGILLRGDLGQPLLRPEPVGELIAGRLPTTIELGAVALIVGVLIGVPIGIYSAVRQDTVGDYVGRSFAIFGLATPNFWLATIILVFPAIWWAWSPPLRLVRLSVDPVRHFSMFIVPGLILGTYLAASTMRMTRSTRLPVDIGDQPVLRRRRDGHQPADRRAVRVPGPARPLRMRGAGTVTA